MDIISYIQEPLQIEIWQGNDWTVVSAGEGVELDGGITFISLSDTPNTYVGQAGKTPVVKSTEDGLEFKQIVPSKFTTLSDCPPSYKNASGKLVRVKSDASGLEFVNVASGTIQDFTQLADVPGTYEGCSGYVVSVTTGENGLEFTPAENTLPDRFDTEKEYVYPRLTVNKQGIITSIESQSAGTIFPDFSAYKVLYGDGTNIPKELDSGEVNSVLVSGGLLDKPSFKFINSLFSDTGRVQLSITETSSDVTSSLQIIETASGVSINAVSSQPTNDTGISIGGQNSGTINIGSGNNKINLNVDTIVYGNMVAGVSNITLAPKGSGTIRVDPIYTDGYSYTANVINENDIANKGYVDKAISNAISGGDRSLYVSSPININTQSSSYSVATGVINKILDEIKILISESFDSNSYITIGDDVENDYLSQGPIYLEESGNLITIPCMNTITRGNIKLYYVNNNSTVGSATVIIKWL